MYRVRLGDREAFAALYKRYIPALHAFFLQKTHDHQVVEDLTQDVFRQVLAKHDTPENKAFMQTEVHVAIRSLAHLFDVPDEGFDRITMPEFHFCHFHDGYSEDVNWICMEPEGITPYRIGAVAGEFLHFTVNPEFIHQKDRVTSSYTRLMVKLKSWPGQGKHFDLGNAHINFGTVIAHYCGLSYNKNRGRHSDIEPEHASDLIETLNSLPDDDKHLIPKIQAGAHYRGMAIAQQFFKDYPSEHFKPLVRLSFSEARERSLEMTGIDLLEARENEDG